MDRLGVETTWGSGTTRTEGADDDASGFLEPARDMREEFSAHYDDAARIDLVVVPGMAHAFLLTRMLQRMDAVTADIATVQNRIDARIGELAPPHRLP